MKKILSIVLILMLATMCCSALADEYIIQYPTHQIGTNTSAPANEAMVKGFNELYEGTYEIQVEEVPGDTNYRDKILNLLQTKDLPSMVYGSNLIDAFYAQDAFVDLKPYLDEDPEWAAGISAANIQQNSRDGKVVGIANETQLIGYYYNTEIFAECGLEGPAKTWDEFFEQCAILKEHGYTPLSMQTGDNAWCSGLFLSAMIDYCAGDQDTFLDSNDKTTDYNVDYFYKALEMLKRIWDEGYTTEDSIGGMYENAAINFISGNTAMIANGVWMIGSFADPSLGGSEEFAEKVDIALYPEGFCMENPLDGFIVTAGDEEHVAAGIAQLKYWTSTDTMLNNLRVCGIVPGGNLEIPEDVIESNRMLGKLIALKSEDGVTTAHSIGNRMYGNVGTEVFSQYLTLYVQGGCTAEEVAAAMTEYAQDYAAQ